LNPGRDRFAVGAGRESATRGDAATDAARILSSHDQVPALVVFSHHWNMSRTPSGTRPTHSPRYSVLITPGLRSSSRPTASNSSLPLKSATGPDWHMASMAVAWTRRTRGLPPTTPQCNASHCKACVRQGLRSPDRTAARDGMGDRAFSPMLGEGAALRFTPRKGDDLLKYAIMEAGAPGCGVQHLFPVVSERPTNSLAQPRQDRRQRRHFGCLS
jgi:hypothetical protein